jgi:non-heme chloroperoxidase
MLSSKIVPGAKLKVYKGGPHGICTTMKNEINADLLEFAREVSGRKAVSKVAQPEPGQRPREVQP